MMKVRKAVIPAAGFGARFLPITKAIPKEMLPIIDVPIIQIVIEELVDAGINDIAIIVNDYKDDIRKYFSPHPELEDLLSRGNKEEQLDECKRLSKLANITLIKQLSLGKGGTGVAILSAEKHIGGEPFVCLWADDFIVAKPSRTKQLLAAFEKYRGNILSCIKKTDPESGLKYGFAEGVEVADGILKATSLVEKPGLGRQPSAYAIVSGYVFLPSIFKNLKKAVKKYGHKREVYYVDGILPTIDKEPCIALEIKNGKYYDTGNKLEYLKTVVEFGMKHPEIGDEFKKYLQNLEI